jgi:hypothetical protein
MASKPVLWLTALGLAAAAGGTAAAQGMMQGGMTPGGMMHGGMMQGGGMDRGTNGQSPGGPGGAKSNEGMQCMMRGGMSPGMGGHQMGGMMHGMMGSGMRSAASGMGGLFGKRVRPVMNLSVDDVRGYLAMRLEHLKNKRLKVGDVKSDDATITADVVTVDNSLVQQLKVDRHTGAIIYED